MTSLPIIFPTGYIATVNVGDMVNAGQTIASDTRSSEEKINILKALKISRNQVKKVLKKVPGEGVNKGDIIAIKKSLFGTNHTTLRSKISGTVLRYERDSGNLVIKSDSENSATNDVISPVDGIITLCDNRQVVIDTKGDVFIGEQAVGDKGQGEILILPDDNPFYLNSKAIGKIVLGISFTREMLLKGIGIGVNGIIAVNLDIEDLNHLTEKHFPTPVIRIDENKHKQIRQWSGGKVSVNAQTKSIILLSAL
jgi:hypothetical protein